METSGKNLQILNFSLFSFHHKPFISRNSDKESLSLQLRRMSGEGLSQIYIPNVLTCRPNSHYTRQVDFMKYNVSNLLEPSNKYILTLTINGSRPHQDKTSSFIILQNTNPYFSAPFFYSLDIRIEI